jgi:hypothetical protein
MSDDLVKWLRDASTEALQAAWRRTDGGQDLVLGAILAEQAADRIEELDGKLNKAIGALEKVQAFVRDLEPHADRGHTLVPALREACETLLELKGETDA